jgi:hypothetical protein
LLGVARVIRKPYEVVLAAALADAGYLSHESETVTPGDALRINTVRASRELKVEDGDKRRKKGR